MTNVALELADKFKAVGVTAVYGETVDVDGVAIIPVALAGYGFGAGEGDASAAASSDKHAAAGGGGGGGFAVPIGAYVKGRDGLRFEPNIISLLAVGVPFVWVVGKALSTVIRALKK